MVLITSLREHMCHKSGRADHTDHTRSDRSYRIISDRTDAHFIGQIRPDPTDRTDQIRSDR